MEGVLQRDALGFLSGPPKVGKSLFALDLCDSLTRGEVWLGKYTCKPANVLYIAREDPPRRVRDRLQEIISSKSREREGRLKLVIREKVNLLKQDDIDKIKSIIRQHKIDLVVLDVVNRMIPGLDENDAAGVGQLVDAMEGLQRTLGVAVLAVDHTRKANGKAKVDPFELKGSIAKYGCCDFIICVGRRRERDFEVYFENKDVDHSTRALLSVSPMNSTAPKFRWKETLGTASPNRTTVAEENRQKIVAAMGNDWMQRRDIVRATGLGESTVNLHLIDLVDGRMIEKEGMNKNTRYRRRDRPKARRRYLSGQRKS